LLRGRQLGDVGRDSPRLRHLGTNSRTWSNPQFGQSTVLIGFDVAVVGRAVTGAHMKRGTTAIMLLAFAIGLATVSAHAQGMGGMGGGGGGHKHQKQTDKTEPQKSKADDKAYNAALKGIPDKPKLDAWQGSR
jgi:hypothetical protein